MYNPVRIVWHTFCSECLQILLYTDTVLQKSNLKLEPERNRPNRNQNVYTTVFEMIIVFKLVQNSQTPHDALYKVHHEVFESIESV